MRHRPTRPQPTRHKAARFVFATTLPLAAGFGPAGAFERSGAVRLDIAQLGAAIADSAPSGATPPAADPQTVTYGPVVDGFAIAFRGFAASSATVSQDGRDLLVRFPRALPQFDAQALQDRATGWIEGVNVGYDALLLRLASGVALRADSGGAVLTIVLARTAAVPDADRPTSAEDAAGAQRLALLDAQLLTLAGRVTEARTRFEAIRAASPGSAEPVVGLAGIEQQAGRWRRSLDLYREARSLDPNDRAVVAAIGTIERSQASRARLDLDHRAVRGGQFTNRADLTFGQASGYLRSGDAWRVGAVVDAAAIRAGQVRRVDGSTRAFSGRRERAELFAQHDSLNGAITVGSLFAGSGGSAGAGLQARVPDDRGVTLLRGEYRRPNWDYVEGLIDNATRDRASVGRVQRFGARVVGRLEVGYNRYAAGGQSDIARTSTVSGDLRLSTLAGIRGLAAVYGIEAEYVGRRAAPRAAGGDVFSPNWILDREVHTATLGYARTAGDRWSPGGAITFDGYGGFGVDRYGRSGPLLAAAVGYARGPVEMQLRASYVRNIGRARTTAATIGGYLSILF